MGMTESQVAAFVGLGPRGPHLGDNGVTAFEHETHAEQVIRAATVINNTPEEHQAAVLALARLDFVALSRCVLLAARAHEGQFDKGGEPYLWHALRVGVSLLPDIDAACAGVLHDVLEDCPHVSEAEILEALAGDEEMLRVLRLLTRPAGRRYFDYLNGCAGHPTARKVKIADILDNLDERRLARIQQSGQPETTLRLRTKYVGALAVLRPL